MLDVKKFGPKNLGQKKIRLKDIKMKKEGKKI